MSRKRVRSGRRPARLCALLGLAAFVLGGCSLVEDMPLFGKSKPVPACPKIKVLADAGNITLYRPGPGRDITDILLEAEIIGFAGACEYDSEDGIFEKVRVDLEGIHFDVTRGPASRLRQVKLRYFVKIPSFYPSPRGAAEFEFRVSFPQNLNSVQVSDGGIQIDIPLRGGAKGADFDIYLGFVLNEDQIERNRQRRGAATVGGG